MLVTEMWMDRVARMTDQPLHSIRQLNLYKEGERTHFGQILHGSQIQVHRISSALSTSVPHSAVSPVPVCHVLCTCRS